MRLRLVVPLLHLRANSTNWGVVEISTINWGRILEESTSNTGKSFVTIAPSKSSGITPNAPLRASILETMNWPAWTTVCRLVPISEPLFNWPSFLAITPPLFILTVTCLYSASSWISIWFLLFFKNEPILAIGYFLVKPNFSSITYWTLQFGMSL